MNKFLVPLLVLLLSACGGSGDTETLKQIVEQNKLDIISLALKSTFTQTLSPANMSGLTPTYYFSDADNSEQITVVGINSNGDEIALSNVSYSIIDNSNSAGASTIDGNGRLTLENLADNSSKTIIVQADFGTIFGTANVVISAFHLQANGLNVFTNNNLVDPTAPAQTITVCDETLFTATGVFTDSTRTITQKVDWPSAITGSNAKFDISNSSKPLFSAHTIAHYPLVVTYDLVTVNVGMQVVLANFSNMTISPISRTLRKGTTQLLTLTASINGTQTSGIENRAKWLSSDATAVSVNTATGEVTALQVSGAIAIDATCGIITQTANITVNDPTLSSIEIRDAPGNITEFIDFTITKGITETTKLKLFAHYSDNSVADISAEAVFITWSHTLSDGLADSITISNTGQVTAKSVGRATITAVYQNLQDSVTFTVKVQ